MGVAEQGLKVPFIVRWPGVVEANSVSETMLNFVDIPYVFRHNWSRHSKRSRW